MCWRRQRFQQGRKTADAKQNIRRPPSPAPRHRLRGLGNYEASRQLRRDDQNSLRLREGKRWIERPRQMIHDSEWRMPAGPGQPLSPGLAGTMEGPGPPL